MTIRIDGITEHQRLLLDTMWGIDSTEEFTAWYDRLTPSNKSTVDVLTDLLGLAIMEEEVNEDLSLAKAMLKSIGVKL